MERIIVGVDGSEGSQKALAWALDDARRRLPAHIGVQGNLDPVACLCPWDVVRAKAAEVMASNAGRPGHIFNLGHGVLPETDPAVLTRLVTAIHEGEL